MSFKDFPACIIVFGLGVRETACATFDAELATIAKDVQHLMYLRPSDPSVYLKSQTFPCLQANCMHQSCSFTDNLFCDVLCKSMQTQ